ncbi:efflux RND transporter periplasmic adaptor subunit [Neokomagataea thailandica]|uniref:Cation efflux system protein CzcB n=1 Tax=Neokomagataea tanensis NBRC 106556 TaxID=1223519 RepID=A0ABQ0QG20_9PROT|nr:MULTISPECIES: efflux RND transporter periplasmic adaptor subunit [Neokomagataea]GBR43483.1 cation efflux system protein CzcB [Neokomagataea tanensis NBRC 106556]
MRGSRASTLAKVFLCVALLIVGYFIGHRSVAPSYKTDIEPAMFTVDHGALVVRSQSPLRKRLVVTSVAQGDGASHLLVPGQVMAPPDRQVNVLSPATGLITQVQVQLGQHVTRGQVLATIAAGDLAQAWADDRRAKAALDFTRRAYDRARGVQAVGGNAVKDMQSARNDLEQAEAEAERASQRLQTMTSRPDYAAKGLMALVAPVDGFIASTKMAPGQNVTDATAVQMTLVDLSTVWVAASAPEDHLNALSAGVHVAADFPALPGRHCDGEVLTRDPALMPDTRRLNLYVACSNADGLLRPGMFANAQIAVQEAGALMVPKTALLMNNDQVSVFVETAPDTFRRRYLDIAYDEGDNVRVLSGLSAGERIVSSGAILLNDD